MFPQNMLFTELQLYNYISYSYRRTPHIHAQTHTPVHLYLSPAMIHFSLVIQSSSSFDMASISTCGLPFPFNTSLQQNGQINGSKSPFCHFPPPSITLMRIRCHSFSCACLLFNWHLIFCSCHFKRENKRLPFIFDAVKRRGLSVTQSDGSVMCFGLQTLLNHLSVSGALHLFLHSGD